MGKAICAWVREKRGDAWEQGTSQKTLSRQKKKVPEKKKKRVKNVLEARRVRGCGVGARPRKEDDVWSNCLYP